MSREEVRICSEWGWGHFGSRGWYQVVGAQPAVLVLEFYLSMPGEQGLVVRHVPPEVQALLGDGRLVWWVRFSCLGLKFEPSSVLSDSHRALFGNHCVIVPRFPLRFNWAARPCIVTPIFCLHVFVGADW